ncbi:MAG TPA: hypothetical protein VLY03_02085 [Bacteroidota bacterium]|nr:hypothetical protein [Bacteroidota bacterium]
MKAALFYLTSGILIGCSQNPVSSPPDIPISQLLASPDTITMDRRQLYLATSMRRDFQPISPPDGKPLVAICSVTATDSTRLPASISADAVWIVYRNQVWNTWFTNETIPTDELRPNKVVKYARNGPKWGPNSSVDVIVRVTGADGKFQLLRAPNQWIGRTD